MRSLTGLHSHCLAMIAPLGHLSVRIRRSLGVLFALFFHFPTWSTSLRALLIYLALVVVARVYL